MDQNLTHRIRERAYEIWAAGGCRDGEADQHWLMAEREILQPPVPMAVAATAAAAGPAKRSAARKVSRPMPRSTPKAARAS
jgi:hypothetical protein